MMFLRWVLQDSQQKRPTVDGGARQPVKIRPGKCAVTRAVRVSRAKVAVKV